MVLSLSTEELKNYVLLQLDNFFPDNKSANIAENKRRGVFSKAFDFALERLEFCFSKIKVRGYSDENHNPYFYHLNSDQYSQFLYYLSNSLWKMNGDKNVCDKLILLNKAQSGMWVSYKNNLPDIFIFIHPVGTVLGNNNYSNYLVVLQNVTVNTISSGKNPNEYLQTFGKGLSLFSGAKIIGNVQIGDWVSIGVDACVYKQDVPSNRIVFRDKDGSINMKEYDTKKRLSEIFFLD